MTVIRWARSEVSPEPVAPSSPRVRWVRSAFAGTAQVTPKVRWARAAFTGTAVATPRVRWARSALAGSAALSLAPIPSRTVEPGETVELNAVQTAGSPGVFAWRVVSISPASTAYALFPDGEFLTLTAPSAVDAQRTPAQVVMVVGVTVTVDGVTSPEQTTTITVLPQMSWVYGGSGFVARPRVYVPA